MVTEEPRGRVLAAGIDNASDVVAGRAQIATFHRAEDIDHAVNVVVIDHRKLLAARDRADVAEDLLALRRLAR